MKFWIFDQQHIYLGSANNDWKSLAQVMEVGVVTTHTPTIAHDLYQLFRVFWKWTTLHPPQTQQIFSKTYQANLTLPIWSKALASPTASPFAI